MNASEPGTAWRTSPRRKHLVAPCSLALISACEITRSYVVRGSDSGRFAIKRHRAFRLYRLLADVPLCAMGLTVEAAGHRSCRQRWISPSCCPQAALNVEFELEREGFTERQHDTEACLEPATGMGH